MKVSIVTVAYNSEHTIGNAVATVAQQTYPDIEYIVVDGNSTDNTLTVLKSFNGQVDKWISEPDHGIYDAMNKGIRLATGDVIGFLNSDDLYATPHVIERVVEAMQKTGADSVYGDLCYFDKDRPEKVVRYWKTGHYRKNRFLFGWMVPHPTFFVRRSAFEQYGLFDPKFHISGDYEIILRFLYKVGITTHYLPEILVKMQAGGASNKTLKHHVLANLEDREAWEKNGLKPYFFTLLLKPIRKVPQFLVAKFFNPLSRKKQKRLAESFSKERTGLPAPVYPHRKNVLVD